MLAQSSKKGTHVYIYIIYIYIQIDIYFLFSFSYIAARPMNYHSPPSSGYLDLFRRYTPCSNTFKCVYIVNYIYVYIHAYTLYFFLHLVFYMCFI